MSYASSRVGQEPPVHDRAALGFLYAAVMLFAALFVGMLVDWRSSYLLKMVRA